jgi:putative sterol carrier protein
MIAGMPTVFQPEVIPGLAAVIQFDVTGEEPGQYFLKIESGQCHAFLGEHPQPQLTIHTPSSVWLRISRGELDGANALLTGEYVADGDMNLMMKFGRLFRSKPTDGENPAQEVKPLVGQTVDNMADVFRGMAERFNPTQASNLSAVIQFKVTGSEKPVFYQLHITEGRCLFQEGSAAAPDVTVITPDRVWLAIARDELDGTTALMEGKYTYEGDLKLLMRMDSLFPKKEQTSAQEDGMNTGNKGRVSQSEKSKDRMPGPIKIPGMQWLTVAFIPWIYFWIFSGSHRLDSLVIPLVVSTAILLYRSKYWEPTMMDMGSPIFFGVSLLLYWFFPETLFQYGPVLGTLTQGLIWGVTLVTDKPLTLFYAKYDYPDGSAENPLFILINSKITAFWVGVYIIQSIIAIAVPVDAAFRVLWMVGNNILLIPAFIFTNRFPEWYIKRNAMTLER